MRCEERTGIAGSLADIDGIAGMLQSSTRDLHQLYSPSLFSIDGKPDSLRRLESGPRACRLNLVVYATHRSLRSTGFHFLLVVARLRARRRSIGPLAGRRRHSSSWRMPCPRLSLSSAPPPCSPPPCCSSCRCSRTFAMLDWMLNTRRRIGSERTVQDRSRTAANGDWTKRPDAGQVRASGLEVGTARRGPVRSLAAWNTGWHRAVHEFARNRDTP